MKLGSDLGISLLTMIPLKKKQRDAKCSDRRPVSLIAPTAKTVASILRRIERKVEDVLGEEQFGFRRRKGTGMQLGC